MKSLIKLPHRPLRLKIMLLLFVLSVLPLAIFSGIKFHDAREEMLHNMAALLTARGDEMKSKPDVFHELYRGGSERFANIPEAETIDREELTGATHV